MVLEIVIMVAAAFKDAQTLAASAQLLLSSLLPLFGTWVGTVLAFYYSKESFKSASRGTLDLVRSIGQRLSSTRVTEVMMPASEMITLDVPAVGLAAVSVNDVDAKFNQTGKNGQRISRLPLVGPDKICLGLLHRGVWAEMLATAPQGFDRTVGQLGALIGHAYPLRQGQTYEQAIRNSVAYVSTKATVAEAKAAMEQKPGCQDVIVTANGGASEALLGWVSNIDIGRLSQA